MAFDLFGFTFGKKEKPQDKVESFVPKNFDDGATVVEAGGFQGGGINFDAKRRRNSTDPVDLFHAHIGGIDTFARALITADAVLQKSDYKKIRSNRYASFDTGKGKEFEQGKLSLEDLRAYAIEHGEPNATSGQQELIENIINRYI